MLFGGEPDPQFLSQCADRLDGLWEEKRRLIETERRRFKERIDRSWGATFSSVEKLLYLYSDIAEFFSRQCRDGDGHWRIQANQKPPSGWLNQTLNVANMRTIRISLSILDLIKTGRCNDAYGLLRVLYEIRVVREFILARGEEVAERYVDHMAVMEKKSFDAERRWISPPEGHRETIENQIREIESKYDMKRFSRDYGWAYPDLPNPTFKSLATAVDQNEHYLFTNASHQLHGSMYGLFGVGGGEDAIAIGSTLHGVHSVVWYVARFLRRGAQRSLERMPRSDVHEFVLDGACASLLSRLAKDVDENALFCLNSLEAATDDPRRSERLSMYEAFRSNGGLSQDR